MEDNMESEVIERMRLVKDEDLDGWVDVEAQERELAYMMELDVHHDIHKINLVD